MSLKTLKKDSLDTLTLEWLMLVKNFKLTLDKNRCQVCEICSLACPKEAITLEKQPKSSGEKTEKYKIDIDLAKCNFCGICDVSCPYGAIKVTVNGKHLLSVIEKESFPKLVRDIQVNESKCPPDCVECEEVCPLDLIKVTWLTSKGKTVENINSLKEKDKAGLKFKVDIKQEYCPCCRICEFKCPEGVLRVRKFLQGKLVIHQEKCPENCTACLDSCPITGALYLSEEDKKIHVNERFCIYCGACKIACPVEEALELKRTKINHTPVRSGAWNKALERLTSTAEMTKELHGKGSKRMFEAVKKRLIPRKK